MTEATLYARPGFGGSTAAGGRSGGGAGEVCPAVGLDRASAPMSARAGVGCSTGSGWWAGPAMNRSISASTLSRASSRTRHIPPELVHFVLRLPAPLLQPGFDRLARLYLNRFVQHALPSRAHICVADSACRPFFSKPYVDSILRIGTNTCGRWDTIAQALLLDGNPGLG